MEQVNVKKAGQLTQAAKPEGLRIDRSVINSPKWRKMIAITKELPGHERMTLMRVVLEKGTGDDLIQLSSNKLSDSEQAINGGGGRYSQVSNGGFVLVEHSNPIHRGQGKDPVEFRTLRHYQGTLWVEAPAAGSLGVLGDVVLPPCPEQEMGRIQATVTVENGQPLAVRVLRFGPLAVDGPYGKTLKFGADGKCESGLIAPGTYKIFLPDFDMAKSRWTVKVSLGMVTQLQFLAHSNRQIDKVGETVIPLAGVAQTD